MQNIPHIRPSRLVYEYHVLYNYVTCFLTMVIVVEMNVSMLKHFSHDVWFSISTGSLSLNLIEQE